MYSENNAMIVSTKLPENILVSKSQNSYLTLLAYDFSLEKIREAPCGVFERYHLELPDGYYIDQVVSPLFFPFLCNLQRSI